jgi:ribonuclease R
MEQKTGKTVVGVLRVKYNGGCWLAPDRAGEASLTLDPKECEGLLPGDRLEVAVVAAPESRKRMFEGEAGREERRGRIVRFIERHRKQVVGVLRVAEPYYAYVVPRDPFVRGNVRLEDPLEKVRGLAGRLVVARLGERERGLCGCFVREIGDPEEASNDVAALLEDHDRREGFSEEVTRECARIPRLGAKGPFAARRARALLEGRKDLRGVCVVTIDPTDARDYDDAVSVERLGAGKGWRLGVHIADVAAYVTPGSKVDAEARKRGNSVYLVDRCVRMLPEELTVRVCSLQPGEDHLTHTVEMTVGEDGSVSGVETFRSVIRSRACLTYDEVQAHFDGGARVRGGAEVERSVEELKEASEALRARRMAGGALDFALPEARCVLGEDGEAVSFSRRAAKEAYALIEECMLAANRAVAEKVRAAGAASVYRVHAEPDAEQWENMAAELGALGLKDAPRNGLEMSRLAKNLAGDSRQEMAMLAMLRNMQRAVYSSECAPHFGLGFEAYAHFTSPIRRYPDLLLHRVLCAVEDGRKPPYTEAEIERWAVHCGDTERDAAELEAQSLQTVRLRYYAGLLEKGETGPFEGMITGLNPKGLLVELSDSLQSGLLPYSAMGKERYTLAPDSFHAYGSRGKEYALGQRIEVGLAAVDEERRRVDFFLPGVEGEEDDAPSAHRKERGKKAENPRGKRKHGGHGRRGRRRGDA